MSLSDGGGRKKKKKRACVSFQNVSVALMAGAENFIITCQQSTSNESDDRIYRPNTLAVFFVLNHEDGGAGWPLAAGQVIYFPSTY